MWQALGSSRATGRSRSTQRTFGNWSHVQSSSVTSMSDVAPNLGMPLFPDGYRAAGLLLHVTSLPSPYGIGDLGPAAFDWIDRLRDADQSWWQALPLGPTGYGNSPYQCLSSFVGNGLLISPEFLIEDGLLNKDDPQGVFWSGAVDYDT